LLYTIIPTITAIIVGNIFSTSIMLSLHFTFLIYNYNKKKRKRWYFKRGITYGVYSCFWPL